MKCFWVVSSLYSYIVVFSHWKILQKTIYFTGVPIESEANKVFLSGVKSTFIHCGIQPLENTSENRLLYACAYGKNPK